MEGYKTFVLDERHEKTTSAFSTAKKQDEEVSIGEFFPPEGSGAVFFRSEKDSQPEVHGIFLGGARYHDQIRTTGLSNNLFLVDFSWDANVVYKYSDITVIPPVKMVLDQKKNSMVGSMLQVHGYSISYQYDVKKPNRVSLHGIPIFTS